MLTQAIFAAIAKEHAPLSRLHDSRYRSKWTHFKEKLIGDTDPSDMMNDIIRTTVTAFHQPC